MATVQDFRHSPRIDTNFGGNFGGMQFGVNSQLNNSFFDLTRDWPRSDRHLANRGTPMQILIDHFRNAEGSIVFAMGAKAMSDPMQF
jgi:hypothetical protein